MSRWYLLVVPLPLLAWGLLCHARGDRAYWSAKNQEGNGKYAESAAKATESEFLKLASEGALMGLITAGLLLGRVVRYEGRIRELERELAERRPETGLTGQPGSGYTADAPAPGPGP
jgi:hypothetical protein